jgi:hypothetical protein
LVDSHVRLLPNADGVHMQWFNQTICSEKVVFKTMQEVFKHAQNFIDLKRKKFVGRNNGSYNHGQQQQDKFEVKSLSISGEEGNKPLYRPRNQQLQQQPQQPHPMQPQQPIDSLKEHHHHQQQQQQQTQPPSQQQTQQQQSSPLYKTRLCERFETEGSCPYGPKCNFAHGIVELRGRIVTDPTNQQQQQQQQHQQDRNDDRINVDSNGNQLFKTKLCDKFMKDKFCQYGPKCHFGKFSRVFLGSFN